MDGTMPENRAETAALLRIENLSIGFPQPQSVADVAMRRPPQMVHAVDGVSLTVAPGETLGLVGESGSGKTTVGRAILGLVKTTGGRIRFDGGDIAGFDAKGWARFRREVQMVFQDPYSSLNPQMSIGVAIAEALRFHKIVPAPEIQAEVERLLLQVGLRAEMAARRPRSLSGGQRQRAGLARALAVRPRFLVLDEPVAALDVSIQAQILNLLKDIRDRLGLSMLFIAHELGVVRHMSDRIAVIYLGKIVETGTTAEIFDTPRHPYTRSLLAAVPRLEPVKRRRAAVVEGDVPSSLRIPSGCRFRTRCPKADARCETEPPEIRFSETHTALCHYAAQS